uniref:fidgetin-like protein 2 n=1 Tax=Oncorhynchus gorbuscha TaxID=8017 RepID=UPI001EAE8C33|nr:fidgetin-like protein 2 [Oncorhynchus gorbuscha]
MLSPVTLHSLLKMHWSPEHVAPLSQWPEQHLDVSSTTSPSSIHKHDPYATAGRCGYTPAAGYPWASDDISALTASSLLKHYAEKYSGLELPYERPAPGAYSEPGSFLKSEAEPWSLGQGMECYSGLEALAAGAKVGSVSVGLTGTGSVTVVSSNLTSDPGYSSSGSCNGPPSQDYPPSYNSSYLSSGYYPQTGSALPPASLHSLHTTPTLVPSYNLNNPVYNYLPGCYPHPQTSLASGYSHPSASYLPSGLSTSTSLTPRPTVVGSSYGYPSHSLGASSETGGPLKRKAVEMVEEGEEGGGEGEGSQYRKYGNVHGNGHSKSPFNGYAMAGSEGQAYKPGKPLVLPPYGGQREYSPSSGLGGESRGGGEHGFPHQRLAMKMPASRARSDDPTGGR